jgi:hypothetical protein
MYTLYDKWHLVEILSSVHAVFYNYKKLSIEEK